MNSKCSYIKVGENVCVVITCMAGELTTCRLASQEHVSASQLSKLVGDIFLSLLLSESHVYFVEQLAV